MPKVRSIKRVGSMAGRVTYRSVVEYPDEPTYSVLFHGESSGSAANVVMQYESGVAGDVQVYVRHPERFGEFGSEWVRRFWESE